MQIPTLEPLHLDLAEPVSALWYSKVWLGEFPELQFRDRTSHAQCMVCIRHRSMIKGLSAHTAARKEQARLFHEHLKAQYQDRLLYWRSRGLSRHRGDSVTLICDGMDQAKWELPRDPILVGKDFATMQKPRLHVSLCIAQGWFYLFLVSSPDIKKDGNASVELLSCALTLLEKRGLNLAAADVFLQHDNTCREFKNNNGLRWGCSQVSCKNIKTLTCSYLRTGHTHEDIDQTFGALSSYLNRVRRLQTPEDVVQTIKQFCAKRKFPFESEQHVFAMEAVREWTLGQELVTPINVCH